MNAGWPELAVLVLLVLIVSPPLGRYIAGVFGDGPAPGDRVFGRVERGVYRVCRVDPQREQGWTAYGVSVLALGVVSILLLYALERLQALLPLDPTRVPAVPAREAFNTAVSFSSNTNWQTYGAETTMSHLTQMAGLTVQNFLSAAAGMAVMAALVRAFARERASTVGNFWVDLTRATVRVLLPLTVLLAIAYMASGAVQNLHGFTAVRTLQGANQAVPGGPVASQVAIKQLGANGGGFFNANSSHPFENPTRLTNFLSLWGILLIAFALPHTFGRMVRDRRQGWAIFSAMFVLWLVPVVIAVAAETSGNPRLTAAGAAQQASARQAGGNMEGKEVRFGPGTSAVWAVSTTATSNGSVDSMHDSYTPSGGLMAMGEILLGEVSPGGVGVGLIGMLIFALTAVFIAGLMVGRTPEYLGKKIQAAEMKLVVLYLLAVPLAAMGLTAASVVMRTALASRLNPGPHGFSEILYAFLSQANNNGSAFAGLNASTYWYATAGAIAMLVGRFFLILPTLAIAGSVARKPRVPPSAGTFPTHTPLFVALLVGVVLIVAGLTYFPALALGPIVEHLSP